jgi:lipid-A-disaccharide synthase
MGPAVLLLAGEESGDLHGAAVARALRSRIPDVRLLGTGGNHMRDAGVELFAVLDDLAVMGFVEVVRHLRFFRKLARRVRGLLASGEIDLMIPIDYPGFNMRMAKSAHGLGVPVLYYIAPQVWAWKRWRAAQLARDADHVAVILPFEVDIFRGAGADVTFVGHPLVDALAREGPNAWPLDARIDPNRPLLALFPGSRKQEVERHLEPFVGAALRLRADRPDLQIAVAQAPSLAPLRVDTSDVLVVDGARGVLRAADAAIVKSGTSTLEATLAGTPFVCAYRTHPFTFAVARRVVKVDHIALANLVAGERVVPELLQDRVTAESLAAEVGPLLDRDNADRARMVESLAAVRERLGTPGAAGRVAEIAETLLAAERGAP